MTIVFGVLLCLGSGVRTAMAVTDQAPKYKEEAARVYDIAETDLAAIADVDSRRIAVFGVKLGDTREEVLKRFGKEARPATWNPSLLFVRLGGKSLDARSAGLVLSFDAGDRVAGMDLETGTRTGELPEVLANKLQGKTRALFLKYSEELRLEVLRLESKKFQVPNPPLTVYQYPLRGLSLGVYRDNQGQEHISGLLLTPPEADKPAPADRKTD